jgi:hypothetical protein
MWSFRNRRAEAAEENCRVITKMFMERIADIQSLHNIIEYEALRERTELKKAHAEELSRAITEIQRLKDDLDRFRLLLTPALQTVELPKEREAREATQEPKGEVAFTGTPFQRLAKQVIAEQEAAAKAKKSTRYVKPAEAPLPQGESHGSTSEGRVDAPLGGTGKPA